MVEEKPPVDMETALLDPGSVFSDPEEILDHPALTAEQKIELLHRWHYDAAEADVATEEGMPGNDDALLRRILLALEELSGGIGAGRTGPTKQDALPRSAVDPKD